MNRQEGGNSGVLRRFAYIHTYTRLRSISLNEEDKKEGGGGK